MAGVSSGALGTEGEIGGEGGGNLHGQHVALGKYLFYEAGWPKGLTKSREGKPQPWMAPRAGTGGGEVALRTQDTQLRDFGETCCPFSRSCHLGAVQPPFGEFEFARN